MVERVRRACDALAPLWPLATYIARHPWPGLERMPFAEALDHLQQVQGVDLLPPLALCRAALAKGEIDPAVLDRRLARWLDDHVSPQLRPEAERVCRALLWQEEVPRPEGGVKAWAAWVEEAARAGRFRHRSQRVLPRSAQLRVTARLDAQMIRWCKLFLDEGQARWPLPYREEGLYRAVRRLVPYDPALTRAERRRTADWPLDAEVALVWALERLGVADAEVDAYLEAHLLALPGWAGMLWWRGRQAGDEMAPLVDYLAVRLALEWTLCAPDLPVTGPADHHGSAVLPLLWAWERWGGMTPARWRRLDPEEQERRLALVERFLRIDRRLLWLEAWEETYAARLRRALTAGSPSDGDAKPAPAVQLLFCIDVRSEPLRRHLERAGPFETYGCAGFFNLPIRKRELDSPYAHPSCPAIVEPQHEIAEHAAPDELAPFRRRRNVLRFVGQLFKTLKQHLLASLVLPELSGPWLGLYMLVQSASPGWAGRLFHRAEAVVKRKPPTRLTLERVEAGGSAGIPVGMRTEEMVQAVKSLFLSIGLVSFAPLVVVCGHRSLSTNNPYAAALECGACGGAAGGFNARVFAALCNRRDVREGLAREGLRIPDETVFVAAEHVTTLDVLQWVDVPPLTPAAQEAFARLLPVLDQVSRRTRAERVVKLPHVGAVRDPHAEACRRATDWSEVRPEWGLAGNAAFVVGRRALTRHVHLDGRVFLHSYDWRSDPYGERLAAIVAGPVTVGQWINLQYYASTVAPHVYGSGSKATQTVTAGIGVMQGNGSDLMTGLPWQSVAASDREVVHAPLRLLVVIEAPREWIQRLLQRDAQFRQKVRHGWIRLASVDPVRGEWMDWEPSAVDVALSRAG
ncbi:DUF2309 domain-containing protein [Thermaerobacter marianensis]|nr:DUF2309 domain-containing protein [Thermaerobacter marianensis]